MQFHELFQPGSLEELDYGFYWLFILYINILF
jgi:hypothetical protein